MAYVTVWKIGPACAAQQAKKVSARTMKGNETNASRSLMDFSGTAASVVPPPAAACGGLRTNSAAGTSVAHTSTAMTACAARQSICVMSQAANGDMVIGATPTPTDTSETASPRCPVIQPMT